MANRDGRFYWLKLKVNFMTSETVDFLMSQKDGANYVVLYQMLCLKTINTDGRLARQIGEIIIPFDEAKIQRDCKWFSIDTIRVGLELYKKLGLVLEDQDGTLMIADHKNLIGSEGDSAERVRRFRNSRKPQELPEGQAEQGGALQCNAECNAQCNADGNKNVTIEIEYRDRDKEIELRDRYIPPNKDNDDVEDNKEKLSVNVQAAASNPNPRDCAVAVGTAWNKTGFPRVRSFRLDTDRGKAIFARATEHGLENVLAAIERAGRSEFLHTLGDRITLDWFLKPENFQKVTEGRYDKKWDKLNDRPNGNGGRQESTVDRLARLSREGAFDE
jgi:hypothetical protein